LENKGRKKNPTRDIFSGKAINPVVERGSLLSSSRKDAIGKRRSQEERGTPWWDPHNRPVITLLKVKKSSKQ